MQAGFTKSTEDVFEKVGIKVMKVMISHIPNTFNYGSAMMAINLIYYLNKEFKNQVEFYTDAKTKEDHDNLIKWTGLKNIKVNHLLPDKNKFNVKGESLNSSLDWVKAYCDGITNYYDYFMVLGGDDLSEYYSKEVVVNELYKLNKISEHIPVILIGQTIGPFTEWRKEYAADKLKNCKIYTRDLLTYNYLTKELKLDNVVQSADLAFAELPMQKEYEKEDLLKKYGVSRDQYVTLVPSGLARLYTEDYERYIENWEGIIDYLAKKYSYKILLLPHVLRPKCDDDRVIIKELLKRNEKAYRDRVIYIKDTLSPLEARLILGNGKFVVTGRMHPAISAFQMDKPAISLSYSVKYDGVIGKELDCGDLIVECAGNSKWIKDQVATEVIGKIDYLDRNYSEILAKTRKNSKICRGKSLNVIKDIYFEIIDQNGK